MKILYFFIGDVITRMCSPCEKSDFLIRIFLNYEICCTSEFFSPKIYLFIERGGTEGKGENP